MFQCTPIKATVVYTGSVPLLASCLTHLYLVTYCQTHQLLVTEAKTLYSSTHVTTKHKNLVANWWPALCLLAHFRHCRRLWVQPIIVRHGNQLVNYRNGNPSQHSYWSPIATYVKQACWWPYAGSSCIQNLIKHLLETGRYKTVEKSSAHILIGRVDFKFPCPLYLLLCVWLFHAYSFCHLCTWRLK